MRNCHIFIEDNPILSTLSQAEYRVLFACARHCDYYDDARLCDPGSRIMSNVHSCAIMEEETGLNGSTIKNALTSLLKKGILLKREGYRGFYYLNPAVMYKGDKKLHKKLLNNILLTNK